MRNKLIDPYISDLNCIERLIYQWINHGSLIIAYDYDNTVFDYHNLGYRFDTVISLLRECKNYGAKFIVFSCSPKDRYEEMGKYLNDNNIPWDKINENIVELNDGNGKIFYNIFYFE